MIWIQCNQNIVCMLNTVESYYGVSWILCPPDEKTCGHAADYILFVLHSFQKTLFRLLLQKMQYSEFTLFILHIQVKQYSDCTVSSLHNNKIPQELALHWFTDISYIIVRIGTVIVAVTVIFSFNSFVSIFGEEIIQGSLYSII
jgi:hypothetical protein